MKVKTEVFSFLEEELSKGYDTFRLVHEKEKLRVVRFNGMRLGKYIAIDGDSRKFVISALPVGKDDSMMYRVIELKPEHPIYRSLRFMGRIGSEQDAFLVDVLDPHVRACVTYRTPEDKIELKGVPQGLVARVHNFLQTTA